MQPIAHLEVWGHLSPQQRRAVTEDIVRIRTEEIKHERIDQDLADAFES